MGIPAEVLLNMKISIHNYRVACVRIGEEFSDWFVILDEIMKLVCDVTMTVYFFRKWNDGRGYGKNTGRSGNGAKWRNMVYFEADVCK